MKAFVTGASGFVGSHVVRALLEQGATVRALVRPQKAVPDLAALGVEVIQGDVRDALGMVRALEGCDSVFHVAALYSTREEDAAALYEVNLRGTLNTLLAAWRAGVSRFVLTSTIGTIGQTRDGTPPDESVPFNMWATASHYARSKHLADLAALALADQGLGVVIVHPTGCVGPGDAKPSATGQRILDFLAGRRSPYPAGGINFVAVTDVAMGHVLAAQRGETGQRYILGNVEGNLKEDEFLMLLSRVTGQPVPLVRQGRKERVFSLTPIWSARPVVPTGHLPAALTANPARALRDLGLPQTPLDVAFSQAVAWFRARGTVR
ncbi:MAG: NAD-dependent epimerase/dehydratase family protein [Anaerolineae bacterium]|nr:NAD-dependent epimerase/dehydratase family protein [Anaerolineae bacterium]